MSIRNILKFAVVGFLVMLTTTHVFSEESSDLFPTVLSQSSTKAMLCVQMQLAASGFDVGKPDGLFGKKTKAASLNFAKKQTYSNGLPELSKSNGYEWCRLIAAHDLELAQYAKVALYAFLADSTPKIFVSDKNPDKIEKALTSNGLVGYLKALHDIAAADTNEIFIDTNETDYSDQGDSVIYIFNDGIRVGDILKTSWSFRLKPNRGWYTEEYEQTVENIDPRIPLVIVNGAAARVHGEFLLKVYLNDKLLSERFILTNKDWLGVIQ